MKTYLECLPCLLRQAVEAAQLATEDERLQHAVVEAVLDRLRDVSPGDRPVDVAPGVHATVRRITGCEDPYRQVKEDSNKLALRCYPKASEIVSRSSDPLLAAAKLAAAGNIADCAIGRSFDFEVAIEQAARNDFALTDYAQFRAEVENAEHVLYLADNAGEIVFDRLLLERMSGKQRTVAVKARPLLNDATADDAQTAGLDDCATVIVAGDAWPRPDLLGAPERLRTTFGDADVIIAKGQGNYEALSECDGGLFFLLTAKCPVVARDLGVAVGDLVLRRAGSR
jgi:uncharacterized protein with ATP-grasp and redox domains